jgi:predicted permease
VSAPLWRRYARLFGRDPRRDVDDEFAFHLEERVEALVASGLTLEAARARALERFGDIAAARAVCGEIGERRARHARWRDRLDALVQDARYAVRSLRRAPGFAATAVLTAALGIGVNTALFTVVDALLLRPLPVARPHEIVRVYTSEAGASSDPRDALGATSYHDYLDFRRAPALAGLAAYMPVAASIRLGAAERRVEGRFVSGDFFATLGVRAAVGRLLAPADARADAPAAVLDHRFWSTALGGDSAVVGATLLLNGRGVTVVGVAAASFVGLEPAAVDVYLPLEAQRVVSPGADLLSSRGDRLLKLVGRLAPGATPERARRDLDAVMRALAAEHPATNRGRRVAVHPARSVIATESAGDGLAPAASLLFAVTGVVLLIAGMNVAALQLARAVSRGRELAVRRSLGAGRGRVVAQLLTESVVLALLAGGVALATTLALPLVARALGAPPSVTPRPDGTVLAFATLLSLATGAAFGLAPALHGAGRDAAGALRGGGASARGRARAQRAFVVAQVALSVVLLFVGGLLAESLRRQREVRPGFDASRLVVAEFEGTAGFATAAQDRALATAASARLRALPAVEALSFASAAPLSGEGMRTSIDVPGYRPAPDEDMEVPFVRAGPEYFRSLGMSVVRGAELSASAADTLPRVVVSAAMARRYWPGRDPVGTVVRIGGGAPAVVVGVAADARLRALAEAPAPNFVVQRAGGGGPTALIRTRGEAAAALPLLRQALAAPTGPYVLRRLRAMDEITAASLQAARAVAAAVTGLSLAALALAVVGLYGVVSYLAAQRTREFGTRVALGARATDVLGLVLRAGLRLALVGGAAGSR